MSVTSNTRKIFILLLAIFVILFALSAPYSTHNIDKLAYVIAMGLDVGQNNKLKLTIQLSKPEGSSGSSSGCSSWGSSRRCVGYYNNRNACETVESTTCCKASNGKWGLYSCKEK